MSGPGSRNGRTSNGAPRHGVLLPALGALVLAWAVVAVGLAAALPGPSGARLASGVRTDFINISATPAFGYTPNEVSVQPGDSVHLAVTQLASFNHTFVLSSVANATIPTTDTSAQLNQYFATHPWLFNLSLGDVSGRVTYHNFTAPALGDYEFVCTLPGHFQGGMHGVLHSGTSSSSTGTPLWVLALLAVVIVAIVVLAVIAMVRRKPKPTPAPAVPAASAEPTTPDATRAATP